MTTANVATMSGEQWQTATSAYLNAEMERLRLLLHRRILWLRKRWNRDTPQNLMGWAITDHEADALLLSGERQAEFEFYATDPDACDLSVRIEACIVQAEASRQEMEDCGTPTPLDLLTRRFGLDRSDRDLILLCLAPEIDPTFQRLYAYVQDDATRRYATAHLAWSLFEGHSSFDPRHLMPRSPLRRWRLLTPEAADSNSSFGTCALRLDERMIGYLLGTTRLDDRCHRVVRAVTPQPLCESHSHLAIRLAQWVAQDGSRQWQLINLVGAADSGRLAIAQGLCAKLGLSLLAVDARVLQGRPAERHEITSLLEREALLLNLCFVVEVDSISPEESANLKEEVERFAAPLIVVSREAFQSEREAVTVPVARPSTGEQAVLWMKALDSHAEQSKTEVEALVEQFDFGPKSIAKAVTVARRQIQLNALGEDRLSEALWEACRQQCAPQMEQLARKVSSYYDWNDIVVPEDVRRQLREVTEQVAHRHQVYQDWGFGKKLSRGRGISALFSGASGVGKTMAAEVMAGQLNLDLYRIDLAGVVSKYIGQTEKNLRSIFDAAERSGAILFFDEADALFGKRSEVKDSHDRYANIEINYLLQRMEDYRGLAVLATNMKSALDSAFMRRLRFIVDFPFPDAGQRREIWRRVFPPAAITTGLDFQALGRLEIPGGNIRNIAVNAAFLAASEGAAIGMRHVMQAARREYTKVDRLILDAEFGRYAGAAAS